MKWDRPNGTTIVTNDLPASIETAKSLGWTEHKEKPVKKAKKKVIKDD